MPEKKEAHIRKKYRLSRFTYFHREGEKIVMESPLSSAKIVVEDRRAMSMIHQLAGNATGKQLSQNLPHKIVMSFLTILLTENFIEPADEAEDFVNEKWEFHDLLFHTRARQGRHSNPYGGSLRFIDRVDPAPAFKTTKSKKAVKLFQPDLGKLR